MIFINGLLINESSTTKELCVYFYPCVTNKKGESYKKSRRYIIY